MDGDQITVAAFETEIANMITQIENIEAVNLASDAVETAKIKDGAVTNAKIAASAGIAISKLDDTVAGALDADVVDGHGGTDAIYATIANPLDSIATPDLPGNLEAELERLRYVIQRIGIGTATNGNSEVGPRIGDGSSAAAWFDGNVVGPNILQNGSFLDNNSTPFGWAVDGAPATQELSSLPVAEGKGKYLHLADASGATTDGIDQTISGVKAGTVYLVEARVLPTTANVVLGASGAAAGSFGPLTVTSFGTSWQTLSGLILTDATPTSIEVDIRPDATNYDFGVAWVSMREVASTASTAPNEHEGTGTRGGNIVRSATSSASDVIATAVTTLESDTTVHVIPPDDGYQIVVWGTVHGSVSGGHETFSVSIDESTNEFSTHTDVASGRFGADAGGSVNPQRQTGTVHFVRETPTPGTVYSYRLTAADLDAGGGAASLVASGSNYVHRITVMLMRMG